MKAFSFCMVLWLVGIVFITFNCLSNGVNRSMLVSGMIIVDGNTMTRSGNLKENRYSSNFDQGSYGDVSMEDYRAIDPPPSSKASVKHRPIEHGTPLMPRIPKLKPSPPAPGPSIYNELP